MKNMKPLLLLLLLVIYACTNSSIKSEIEEIDLRSTLKGFKKGKHLTNLSSIFSKIEYISLETDSVNLISTISKPNVEIKILGNNIFFNQGEILRFDLKGKFLNSIGSIGKGPNEYVDSNGFTPYVKGQDTLIGVYSRAQHKFLKYNIKGEHINNFSVDFWPMDLASLGDNLIFLNYFGNRNPSKYYTFSVLSEQYGKLKRRLIFKEQEKETNNDLMMSSLNKLYKYKDTLSYWESNYDTIWRITKDYKTIPKYYINIGDNKLSISSHTPKIVKDYKKYYSFNNTQVIFETINFIFLKVVYNKRIYRVFYNKKSKESNIVEFKKPFGRGTSFSFYNDLDGGIPFWPMGNISENKLYMIVYGYEMKDYIARKGNRFNAFDKVGRDKLLKLVENSKISDNPILMVATLKD